MSLNGQEHYVGHRESQKPRWANVWLIYTREMRDQLRDRRTLFTIIVLPILLYPLVGTLLLQIAQFSREYPMVVCVVGNENVQDLPPLLSDTGFAEGLSNSKQPLDLVQYRWDDFKDREDINGAAANWVRDGIYDVVLVLPPELSMPTPSTPPESDPKNRAEVDVIFNVASDQSTVARDRIAAVLNAWRDSWVTMLFQSREIDLSILKPFQLNSKDISPTSVRDAAFWSKILPFVMLIWAMTGAFYPAIDLVAGEKERGTLETLLCSPALRGEIVWGKLAAVTTFSMMTAILNVSSMLVTSTLVFRQISIGASGAFSAPPLIPFLWLVVALVPLSALFSAVALAVAAMARSSKEGQYYLMPLMMVSLPLVLLPMIPGTTLSTGTSLVPVTGMFLMVRALVEGQYSFALMHLPMVFGVTAAALCLATRWARRQFETESVLFAGGEQWELSSWARRIWQDREPTATPMQAYSCAALILIALFFGKLAVTSMPQDFAGITKLIAVPQIGLILAPTLLMAVVCTRSLRLGLRLTIPDSPIALPMAIALGICLHPLYVLLASWVSAVYPISETSIAAMKPFTDQIASAPWLSIVLLLAVLPAFCEELAFRGFIFGGLARNDSPMRAIIVTSIVFGISHGVLQQSITATFMGLLIGWIAYRTGSVLPGILIHVISNTLSISLGRISEVGYDGVEFFVQMTNEGPQYQPIWTVIAGCIALCCLFYFTYQNGSSLPDGECADSETKLAATASNFANAM